MCCVSVCSPLVRHTDVSVSSLHSLCVCFVYVVGSVAPVALIATSGIAGALALCRVAYPGRASCPAIP
jgi:hypothetical protein